MLAPAPSPKNGSKTYRKSLRNRPKTIQNRSQANPKSIQNRLRNRPRCQHRFWNILEPFSDRFGPALGGLLAASLWSSWGKVGPKIDFWRSWMAFKNEHDAGYLSEPIFGQFWDDFGVQNRLWNAPRATRRPVLPSLAPPGAVLGLPGNHCGLPGVSLGAFWLFVSSLFGK